MRNKINYFGGVVLFLLFFKELFYPYRSSGIQDFFLNDFSLNDFLFSFLVVLIIFLKILSISSFLYLGFWNYSVIARFKDVCSIVVVAEFVFIFPSIFEFFQLNQLSIINLSLISILDINSKSFLYFPAYIFSFYEFIYWISLSFLLSLMLKFSFDLCLKIVLFYYVSFLFCWVVFVMFISLGNS